MDSRPRCDNYEKRAASVEKNRGRALKDLGQPWVETLSPFTFTYFLDDRAPVQGDWQRREEPFRLGGLQSPHWEKPAFFSSRIVSHDSVKLTHMCINYVIQTGRWEVWGCFWRKTEETAPQFWMISCSGGGESHSPLTFPLFLPGHQTAAFAASELFKSSVNTFKKYINIFVRSQYLHPFSENVIPVMRDGFHRSLMQLSAIHTSQHHIRLPADVQSGCWLVWEIPFSSSVPSSRLFLD